MSTPPAYGGPPQQPMPAAPSQPTAPPRRGPGRWIALGCAGLLGVALVCGLLTALGMALGRNATPTTAARSAPTRTAAPTRTVAAASRATTTRTGASASPPPLVISGCGGGAVQIGFDAQLRNDLDQWNRVVGAANPVTRAWNDLLTVTNGIKTHQEAAGNAQLIAAADNYLTAAQVGLPALQAEKTGRFATLAAKESTTIEVGMRWTTLLRTAAADSNVEAWNQAIDVSDEVDAAKTALDAEVETQCSFWRSRR